MGKLITGPGLLYFADGTRQPFLGLDTRGVYLQRGLLRTWAQLAIRDNASPATVPWRDLRVLEITDGTINAHGAMDGHLKVTTTNGAVRSAPFTGFYSVEAMIPPQTDQGLGRIAQIRFAENVGGTWRQHLCRISFAVPNAV
jgi:hypothetical protein